MTVAPVLQDLRFAVRMLRRNPFLSLTVVVTLSLGIGFVSTTFNIANGFIHKDLPFDEADRIMAVDLTGPTLGPDPVGFTARDLVRWRERQSSLQGLAPYGSGNANLSTADGHAERLSGGYFGAGMFEALGVAPEVGRTFTLEDERPPAASSVVVISHHLWQSWFDGAADVVGRVVEVNRHPRTVVGVMPPGFSFPFPQDFWIPVWVDPLADPAVPDDTRWSVAGRVVDGVTPGAARANLDGVAARLAGEFPQDYAGVGVAVTTLKRRLVPLAYYPLFYTLVAASFGVLLIGCANITTLLLARGSARTLELAMRSALGASRRRVIRQLTIEVLILALAGGSIGLGLGLAGLAWFDSTLQAVLVASGDASEVPVWMAFTPDVRVYLFVAGATAFAAVFAGLIPAWRVSSVGVGELIKTEARGASSLRATRFTGALVVAEVAASCLLLVLAGLMFRSLTNLATVDLPFATDHVFTARLTLPGDEYPDEPARRQFFDRLLSGLTALPGVTAASLSDGAPGTGYNSHEFEVEGLDPDQTPHRSARFGRVTPAYFDVFRVRAVQGRLISERDREGSLPVAVVNQSFARTVLGSDVIGRRLRTEDDGPWHTIVGVVPDLAMETFGSGEDPSGFYLPFAQTSTGSYASIALGTRGDPMSIAADVRAAIASIDRYLPIYRVMPMEGVMLRVTWFYPVFGNMLMLFGGVALFLGAVGLYGVMSFAVTQRTKELGIRLAMGARTSTLIGQVMRKAIVRLGAGMSLGLLLAIPMARQLSLFLYEIDPADPLVFGGVVAALAGTGVAASFVPARRITKVDPLAALSAQ